VDGWDDPHIVFMGDLYQLIVALTVQSATGISGVPEGTDVVDNINVSKERISCVADEVRREPDRNITTTLRMVANRFWLGRRRSG